MSATRPGGAASLMVVVAMLIGILAHGVTREVPLGGIDGRVLMAENGRPLGGATVILRTAVPVEGFRSTRVFEVKPSGQFTLRNLPAGSYTIEAYARAHSLDAYRFEVREGSPQALDLELKPHAPYLRAYANQRVFTPDEAGQIQLEGFIESDDLSLTMYRVEQAAILEHGGVAAALSPIAYRSDQDRLKQVAREVRQWSHRIENRDPEGVFMESVELPKMQAGIYWVRASSGAQQQGVAINVTRIGLVTKRFEDTMLCFVTDVVTGKPLAGVPVSTSYANGVRNGGITDERGLATVDTKAQPPGRSVVIATHGDSQAFVDHYAGEARDSSRGARLFAYTERPVYRPGDTIQFKTIVRRLVGNDYQNVPNQPVEVELRDPEDGLVDSLRLESSDYGTCAGSFTTNREVPTGGYRLVARLGSAEYSHYFSVSAYRKPEYTVSIKPLKGHVPYGAQAEVAVECQYFFGGPVVGAQVEAYVTRQPYWDYSWMDEEWADFYAEEAGAGGEYVEQVEAQTDENGRAILRFATRMEGDSKELENDYTYWISAWVREGDRAFEGTGQLRVTRGDFNLQIETDRYVLGAGETAEAKVAAIAHEGKRPVAGKTVRVETGREVWDGNTSQFLSDRVFTVKTGADGIARFPLQGAEPGSLTVRVSAEDAAGRVVKATEYLYVEGGVFQGPPVESLQIKLDRNHYSVGDTAKAVISAGAVGGSAWVTVEGDRVYWSKVVEIEAATIVEFPITKDMSPNAFLTVAYTRNKRFFEATARVAVSLGDRKLQVEVSSDRQTYEPGQTASYTILTRDEQGNPVPAEVSLSVVDESIYAIKEDKTDILEGFYPKRYNAVQTLYSFAELYLDGGDKSPAEITVRSRFLDTAYWN
ncbi:MAG TPA: MG2 domain-containing protein, partial [Fimbriimonadaceae bacterium]|nr:MG2 domain-containing protein [Fimbriimonadaceae bacterium]